MAQKGFSMQDILREVNKKLKHILPVGFFCCACMCDLNFRKETIEIWVGGLPDIFIHRMGSDILEGFRSTHLPLGVLSNERFNVDTQVVPMKRGDRVYMWSDGILEATDPQGQMFGEEGVRRIFQGSHQSGQFFDDLIAGVEQFTGKIEQDDDYTAVEVTMVSESELGEYFSERGHTSLAGGPKDWAITYELRPQTLREFNPLPLLTHLLMEIPGLRPHSGKIYTILAELFSNALEHGVLGLASSLKASPTGFAQYYQERTNRLLALEQGYVRFHLDHKPVDLGGELTIRVEDTGPGFDFKAKENASHKTEGYSGRGIPLINTMCKSVRYLGKGNEVEVVYAWHVDA
jgi:anti-sigma regulatory factor (Ser/Thr protein kinase)